MTVQRYLRTPGLLQAARNAAIALLPNYHVGGEGASQIVLSPELLATITPHPKEKIVTGGLQAGKSTSGFIELLLCYLSERILTQWGAGLPDDYRFVYWVVVPSYKDP